MSFRSSISEISRAVMVKAEVEVAVPGRVVEAYKPPEVMTRALIVSKVEEAPWETPGKNPLPMFVKTKSSRVLVAFRNSTDCQFSKLVRFASTCPSNTVETASEVEPRSEDHT